MSDRPRRTGDPFAGIPGRRLFVGVPLPDDAAAAVVSIVDAVRGRGLPTGARDVRWVRLDGLHLTLRFLGPTPDEMIPRAAEAVRTAARSADGPVDLELAGTGSFPSPHRPRTLWIGIQDATGGLTALRTGLEDALVAAGWPPDDRPFHPHLTLARADGIAVGPLVADRLAAAVGQARIAARIEQVGLFESVTGGGPARYVPVDLARLGLGV
ncbi:MAG TPA: RNA 2',3'-cyclic phosphodiesterase [Candidatus Limnocylindrales bacterium]|nr:RNA 2',3'-cyclic phosphodiesterase [Candidatus Limnocylindrales bacterium]